MDGGSKNAPFLLVASPTSFIFLSMIHAVSIFIVNMQSTMNSMAQSIMLYYPMFLAEVICPGIHEGKSVSSSFLSSRDCLDFLTPSPFLHLHRHPKQPK